MEQSLVLALHQVQRMHTGAMEHSIECPGNSQAIAEALNAARISGQSHILWNVPNFTEKFIATQLEELETVITGMAVFPLESFDVTHQKIGDCHYRIQISYTHR